MKRCFALLWIVVLTLLVSLGYSSDTVDEPDGYRLDHYDALVPSTLKGATVVSAEQAKELVDTKAVIPVDVLPAHRRPQGMESTTFWLPPTHYGIPTSLWLPDVGRGEISDELDLYFRTALETVSSQDLTVPFMFYCRPDCWMSWNAAKRAVEEYGYSNVYWFPDGITGWSVVSDETEALQAFEPAN